jgi:uncharacterized lipoprotein YmbA
MPTRRHLLTAAASGAALLLAACAGSSNLPPVQLVRLPAEAPGAAAAPAQAVPGVWQLMAPVQLPGHLDRDALLVPQGAAGLQGLGGARWAEPLRDAVPRLLRQDLEREFGAPVWSAPLPPGVLPTRQLRVELGAFDVAADHRGVLLAARWSLADAKGGARPVVFDARFTTPAAGLDANDLAIGHRQALSDLARRIADSARAG